MLACPLPRVIRPDAGLTEGVELLIIADQFLWDFRKTIGDLIADEHYGQVQASLKESNRSSVLINFWISARVLSWTRRKAISQMTL